MKKSTQALLGAATALLAGAAPAGASVLEQRVAEAKRVAAATSVTVAGTAPTCEALPARDVRAGHYASVFPDCASNEADGPMTIRITDRPDHGNLNVYTDGGWFYYAPDAGFTGTDVVKVVLANTVGESAEQTITFNVAPSVNTAPFCYSSDAEVDEIEPGVYAGHAAVRKGSSRTFTVYCADADGDGVTVDVKTPPASGTLAKGPAREYGDPTIVYTPDGAAGDNTEVEAIVQAKDEHGLAGNERTVGFRVKAADYNTAPECESSSLSQSSWQAVEAGETSPLVDPWCWDHEGDAVTLSQASAPTGATLTFDEHGVSITPSADSGSTTFTYKGTDAKGAQSEPASVGVRFVAPHGDPGCAPLTLNVASATRAEGDVACSDPDGDPLHAYVHALDESRMSWTKGGDLEVRDIKDGKVHFAYTPDAGFSGEDGFLVNTFDAFDSAPEAAKVTINVGAPASTPAPTPPATTPPGPTPAQALAAMQQFLRTSAVQLLQQIARSNKKGIDLSKLILVIGQLDAKVLPNGGSYQFGVFDKPGATGLKARAATAKRKLLGSVKGTLAKGQSKKVQVKLNKKGKALLKKKGKVKLTVDATLTDALTGAKVTQSKTYTFKVAKKKKRK